MFKIYKRGNTYHVQFSIRGKRIRESTRTTDKTLAEDYASKRYAELFQQIQVGKRPAWKWADAVKRYLTEKGGRRKTKSTTYLLQRLDPYFGKGLMALRDISGNFIRAVLDDVAKGNSVATRNRYGQLIRAILRSAANRWEDDTGRTWIEKAPYIEILPENNARDRWLNSDEARDLVIHLPIHLAEMVCVALYTGLRESNITNMEWSWVDLDRRVVIIPREHSKTGKPIPVYLVDEAFDVIQARHGIDPIHVFTFRKRKINRINNTGWITAKKAAGLNDIRVHDLRRTWASWHFQNGTTIDDLLKIGGWASPEIVRARYAHLAPEQLRAISENVKPSLRAVK